LSPVTIEVLPDRFNGRTQARTHAHTQSYDFDVQSGRCICPGFSVLCQVQGV